ncbi:MAG TPA: hypothetical protein VFX53_04455 [Pedococcus sp.]|nr:hypothetical protein [Pedococcus sp.]
MTLTHAGYGNIDLPIIVKEPIFCGVCNVRIVKRGSTTLALMLRALDQHIDDRKKADDPQRCDAAEDGAADSVAAAVVPLRSATAAATITHIDRLRKRFHR